MFPSCLDSGKSSPYNHSGGHLSASKRKAENGGKMNRSKIGHAALLLGGILIYTLITLSVVFFYHQGRAAQTVVRLVQNSVYIGLFCLSLLLMRISRKPFTEYGLFVRKLPMQLLIGLGIGIGLNLLMLLFGSVPSLPKELAYTVFSQLITGFSEEIFWRGFVLCMLRDLSGSKDVAVGVSALLFALSHFAINLSAAQVIAAFLVGVLLAVLRTEFADTVGVPALSFGHAIANIF